MKTEYTKTTYGWTRWINPKMKGYLLKCCDCGLIHELEFKAIFKSKYKKENLQTVLPEQFAVSFRARRRKI